MSTVFSQVFDKDVMTAYEYLQSDRVNGDYLGVRVVSSVVSQPCSLRATDNFDDASAVGYYKRQGVQVSDKLIFDEEFNLQPEWFLKVVTKKGNTKTFRIAGAEKARELLGRGKVYLTPTSLPPILT